MEDTLEMREVKRKRYLEVLALPTTASALTWAWKRRSEVTRVLWCRGLQELLHLRTAQPHLDSRMGSDRQPG